MRLDCEAVQENVDAWALGALAPEEARALEGHLDGCAACHALADEATAAAASLGLAVPMRSASVALKSRVVASAAVLTDIGKQRRARMWYAAVAALAIIGTTATAWAVLTQVRMNDLEDRNAAISADATLQAEQFGETVAVQSQLSDTVETQNAILEIVLEPDVQRTELMGTSRAPAATGRCVWSRARASGALIVDGLPPPPSGSVYAMWIVYEREWLDAGRFTVDEDGQGHLLMREWGRSGNDDWGDFEGFAVTVEAASAEPSERGDTVMASVPAD
jgi:hypothetical protein